MAAASPWILQFARVEGLVGVDGATWYDSKRPEIALVSAGAGFDLAPEGPHTLPDGYADRVHASLPRLHAAPVLHDSIVGQALDKPHKAPPFSIPGELVRRKSRAVWPTWRQLMTRSPGWNDYDGYRPKT